MSLKITPISNGVEGLYIKNDRFNTTLLSFNFYLPLKKETVAENALLPFILTTCSKQYPDFSALNYKLAKLYGATLNASTEKFGDCQLLQINISVVNDRFTFENESLLVEAASLLTDLIFNPNCENSEFLEADLKREKRKAIEHIKSEISEKRIYAKNRLISEMFKDDCFGVQKCGTIEDVEKITGKSLYLAWQRMLRESFIRIQVVSSSKPPKFFENLAEKFDSLDRQNITNTHLCKPTAPAIKPNHITETMEIAQGKLVMGFSSDMYGDDDVSLPLMVASDIFGGGPYSRLFTNVREKLSLCYYCSSSAMRQKGLLTVDSGVEKKNAEKAEKEILNQLEIVKNGKFSDFEFESSIKSISDSLNSYNDSQSAINKWYIMKINNEQLYSPEDIAEKLKLITREDVIYAAKGIKLHTVYKLLPTEAE